jgi:hypothetical protein
MAIVQKLAAVMQVVFGMALDDLARSTGCVQRERKFSGVSLLRMLVLTVMQKPTAKDRDYRSMAAKLGIQVTEEAIGQRFTSRLIAFLEESLKHVLVQTLRMTRVTTTLLQKFTDVRIGDSTTLLLPDEFAEQFPGCGGTGAACKAALKVQVLWSLVTGELLRFLLEPGRASDNRSAIADEPRPAGSLSIFDLGYFRLERFRQVGEASAYWISRFQHGTKVFDPAGNLLDLLPFLREHGERGLVDLHAILGETERLACRLIAVRVPPEVAARRRQKIREKARDHGREPSQEYLDFQEWTIFITNCSPELLTWKEVVVLYRARWQIELLFKLWKSHNCLAARELDVSPQRQMAVLYAKLIGVIVQHWILLTATWNDAQRSLRKAAALLSDWVVLLSQVLDDPKALCTLLVRLRDALAPFARVQRRRKHPSLFQLLDNPELLEYTLT